MITPIDISLKCQVSPDLMKWRMRLKELLGETEVTTIDLDKQDKVDIAFVFLSIVIIIIINIMIQYN